MYLKGNNFSENDNLVLHKLNLPSRKAEQDKVLIRHLKCTFYCPTFYIHRLILCWVYIM